MSIGSGSLFSIFMLCKIMDIACCMAMTLIASNVYLKLNLWILNVFPILSIGGICVVALAPAMTTTSGYTFQPMLTTFSINGLYFYIFTGYSFIWYSIITICKFNGLYC